MRMVLFLLFTAVSIGCVAEDNLRGSVYARANEDAVASLHDFEYFEDDAAMEQAKSDGRLVPVPNNQYVRRHKDLPEKYAYVLPHVRDWLIEKGRAFHREFGKPIIVTSAVRPKTRQTDIGKRNGNAAPANGLFPSTHPTGATIDIGYKGLNHKEIAWLKQSSSRMESDGKVQATMELYQPCFHIMVYSEEFYEMASPEKRLASAE